MRVPITDILNHIYMNILFKDVAHLYLGCEVAHKLNDVGRAYLTGVRNGGAEVELQVFEDDGINVSELPVYELIEEITPILRPVSDMDEAEGLTFYGNYIFRNISYKGLTTPDQFGIAIAQRIAEQANWFTYLLSRHFDLFGLIESGAAIDATTLPNNPYKD